ncbi:hypothetical protein COY90_01305 [Candidatus Roizmanbacteria bacterium CG_4_10_14_0_8_um_filter_39_9]|uniref:Toxin HicA n=1 Tax=Candidatus Roizmanbacteria bacterium CG_4_10_14_0_8_um_filter_39_9 TaxID=1974829 RepID=A0A2M7QDN4_9BACT|nr:MAG: hypothetical protein COY90_01305 [Candidatus Roizmanbacteria bacterium CG_4_10_14_0_8_um_filter_39_9]
MSKLPVLKPKQVLKKLEKLGFVIDRQSESHLILLHSKTKRRAVIPIHLADIKKGTLSAILRESGINRDEFISA